MSEEFEVHQAGNAVVKSWARGVPIEQSAKEQLLQTAQMPFIYKWLAAMPDVHTGIGATVGSVIATKGAIIPAAVGVIPGSMGAKSFIVRGKGNPESFCSCSHGAGRKMSRTEAKRRFTIEDHEKATAGVECRKDASVIDETPGAYKDIDAVMAAQASLVEVVHTLKQVCCIKG